MKISIPAIAVSLLLVVGCAGAQTTASDLPRTLDQAQEQAARQKRQSTPPSAEQWVAVLTLALESENGELRSARVENVRIINAVAPKVFARSGGTWEVRLRGEQAVSYRMVSPLDDIEIENPHGAPSPYSQVRPTGSISVPVIVPLSRDGKSLGVRSIEIVDLATGQTVVETPVRRQAQ